MPRVASPPAGPAGVASTKPPAALGAILQAATQAGDRFAQALPVAQSALEAARSHRAGAKAWSDANIALALAERARGDLGQAQGELAAFYARQQLAQPAMPVDPALETARAKLDEQAASMDRTLAKLRAQLP